MTSTPNRAGRLEGSVEVIILIAVAVMAGAASFTHVHDWTMDNAPTNTGSWFGWANAMVSELIPLAAGLEARRRRRVFGKAGVYPIALILAAVALSLTGQFGEAKPSISGWVISAVPALGFLALVKLILSSPAGNTTPPAPDTTVPVDIPSAPKTVSDPPPIEVIPPATPAIVPDRLVSIARFAATNHEQTTGQPITADELSARISVTPAVAGQLLSLLGIEPAPTRVNGSIVNPALSGGTR